MLSDSTQIIEYIFDNNYVGDEQLLVLPLKFHPVIWLAFFLYFHF